MTKVVEGVLTIVKGLNPKDRREFFRELMVSGVLTEDEQDFLVITSRRGGPTRRLDDFASEMRKKGRLSEKRGHSTFSKK